MYNAYYEQLASDTNPESRRIQQVEKLYCFVCVGGYVCVCVIVGVCVAAISFDINFNWYFLFYFLIEFLLADVKGHGLLLTLLSCHVFNYAPGN